jgi:CheY-like chemotaxis protein
MSSNDWRDAAQAEGRQIAVRSRPGDGTTVALTFPSARAPGGRGGPPPEPAGAAPDPRGRPPADRPSRSGLRVLAVDDEPSLRALISMMLERDGHAVTTAATGEEGLERLASAPFDLVISDVGLGPGINGWELGRQVRARFPGTRFALLTGWEAQIDPAEASAIGVEAVLAKPFRAADLRRLLAGAGPA